MSANSAILGLFRKQYVCWVCLDSECINDDWIVHQCGCNLQVHRKCLIGWIFDLNKSRLGSYYTYDTYKINSTQEISRRLCFLLDQHKDFGREIGFAETVQDIPLIGQTWASFICVGEILVRALARLNSPDTNFSYDDLWRGLPEEVPPCPQCKSAILKKTSDLQYRSPIWPLKVYGLCRNVTRYFATVLTLHGYFFNPIKCLFKVGLWQLRSVFSESSLRRLLEISNSKALDVYGESLNGIMSLSNYKRLTIIGFPIYLFTFKADGFYPYSFRMVFPWILLKNFKTNKLINDTVTLHSIAISAFNLIVRPILDNIYRRWIYKYNPYFLPKKWATTTHWRPGILSISRYSVDFSNLVIKSQWYDSMIAALAWPYVSHVLGEKLMSRLPSFNAWLIKRYPSASPDDCQLAYTLSCSLSLYIGYEIFKLGMTYLRLKELTSIQDIGNSPSNEDCVIE